MSTLQSPPSAAFFQALETTRTQALVQKDMPLAWRLHAPDYQLITPAGKVFERQAYLDAVADGSLAYAAWQVGAIAVRSSPAMALVRYAARITFDSGRVVALWHTDSYELQDGQWLAVWSQATVDQRAAA
jgi:hypothetical protein